MITTGELPRHEQLPGRDGKTLCEDVDHQWTITGVCAACKKPMTPQEYHYERERYPFGGKP